MTQHKAIMEYIEKHGSITPMHAFSDLGITKLATRVSELIQSGQQIKKVPMLAKNRYGETVRFMRYEKAV